ncbi:hypothetical protein E2C01_032695 [Portunus trituberculatus]|uniref:Uncharacterized protein n=1 Tax=Portunus trituberculatus TaxID=210409 RepID=A0A5B7EVX4_PORTR|nr:hypothetical protein [Portunus trituberculatus]
MRISQGWVVLIVVLPVLYAYCLASSTVLLPASTGRDRSLPNEEVFWELFVFPMSRSIKITTENPNSFHSTLLEVLVVEADTETFEKSEHNTNNGSQRSDYQE